MGDIKVSVIIPVYNAEKYLRQCLDSVLNQSLHEIEVICVDDGSIDNSSLILKEYANIDKRIKILRQDNKYAGVARNNGFEIAKGEYVIFLDADDFFNPTLLEKIYWKAKSEEEADVVLFGGQLYHTDTDKYNLAPHLFKRDLLPSKEIFCRKDIPDKFLIITTPCPWTKLFRREFILKERLRFQPLKNSNDVYFTLTALALARTITYVDEDLVYYRVDQDESSQSMQYKQPILFLKAYEAVYDKLNSEGIYKDVEKSFTEAVLSSCNYVLDRVKNSRDSQLKIYKELTAPSFTRMGLLDHPLDYYSNRNNAIKALGAKYIIEWYEKCAKTKGKSFQVLIDNRIDNNVLVSVIIPVYNTALYVGECLESICKQTLAQIEIICINDGSTDESLDILQKYAKDDNRIVVCTQENRGQGLARNKGVAQARGEYLYFMDSDDVLEFSALETLYEKAKAANADVIYFNGDSFTKDPEYEALSNQYTKYYTRNFDYDGIYEGWKLLSKMVQHDEYRVSPCLQFINRNYYLQNKIDFYEEIIHEDNLFNYKCMLCAKKVEYLPLQLFHRRMRPDSTMTKKVSFANAYGYFICHLKMNQFYNEQSLYRIDDDMMYWPVKQMLNLCRINYQRLLPEEKQTIFALSCNQRQLFEAYVVDVCNERLKTKDLQANVKYAKKELKDAEKKLKMSLSREASLKKSISFRIGRAITWFPRKMRGGVQCYNQHGAVYTIKRLAWHVINLK